MIWNLNYQKNNLLEIYNRLYRAYGPQNWWPGETQDEIIIGAILTQNTNWLNVEKAISNLKKNNLCSLDKISKMNPEYIAELIKPSGYFNQKSIRLTNIAKGLDKNEIQNKALFDSRKILLDMKGIGPETADSILLYAFEKGIFVIDAYTIRIFSRIGLTLKDKKYDTYQNFFMENLEHDVKFFNEYHGLIVRHCKISCKKIPNCEFCCLSEICECKNI
ncbi:MAG: endonuclease [Candidatus Cloacimonetes bacterium]|nr:endonuclease [Candidatus Cloacimonadota bacterium]